MRVPGNLGRWGAAWWNDHLAAEARRDNQQPASWLAVDLVGNQKAMPPARPDEVLETQEIFDWMWYPAALLWKRSMTGSVARDTWMTTQFMKVMTKGVQPKPSWLQAECSSGHSKDMGTYWAQWNTGSRGNVAGWRRHTMFLQGRWVVMEFGFAFEWLFYRQLEAWSYAEKSEPWWKK